MNDLLSGCMSDLQTTDSTAFMSAFCQVCRNPECKHAKWAGDRFASRVSSQADRLLRPEQADPNSSRYQGIQDFQDLMTQAIQLEIADKRGDWNVPSIPILRGNVPSPVERPKLEIPNNFIMDDGDFFEDPEPVVDKGPQGQPATIAPAPKVGAAEVKMGNTPVPTNGMMIGDDPPPRTIQHDPWAAPVVTAQIIKPGATIKMGDK